MFGSMKMFKHGVIAEIMVPRSQDRWQEYIVRVKILSRCRTRCRTVAVVIFFPITFWYTNSADGFTWIYGERISSHAHRVVPC